jgi:hypothetical protein
MPAECYEGEDVDTVDSVSAGLVLLCVEFVILVGLRFLGFHMN